MSRDESLPVSRNYRPVGWSMQGRSLDIPTTIGPNMRPLLTLIANHPGTKVPLHGLHTKSSNWTLKLVAGEKRRLTELIDPTIRPRPTSVAFPRQNWTRFYHCELQSYFTYMYEFFLRFLVDCLLSVLHLLTHKWVNCVCVQYMTTSDTL